MVFPRGCSLVLLVSKQYGANSFKWVRCQHKFQDAIFLSLTNKTIGNPENVISSGINAKSQLLAIKKYLKANDYNKTLVLIPKKNFKEEIEEAIIKSKLKTKKTFYYDAEPTKLTKQIEKVTKYKIRKNNLKDEIKRVENSDENNKEKKLELLNKKDTSSVSIILITNQQIVTSTIADKAC